MLSAFQSIMPAQLIVSQIMSPSENFLEDVHACDYFLPVCIVQLGAMLSFPVALSPCHYAAFGRFLPHPLLRLLPCWT